MDSNLPNIYGSNNLDFSPVAPLSEIAFSYVTEVAIMEVIVEGSGGPDNLDMNEGGLRFIRHLLSTSYAAHCGILPNFKDLDSIRKIAREFIRSCGGSSIALQTMYCVMQSA